MKKSILVLSIFLAQLNCYAQSLIPFSVGNISSALINKVFITIPSATGSIVYQMNIRAEIFGGKSGDNDSKIIITPQKDGMSLKRTLPKASTIKNLMKDNKIIFAPLDKALFPTITLTTDDATKSISLDSSMKFTLNGSTDTLAYHTLLYIELLINYLKTKGFSGADDATGKTNTLLYKNKPVEVQLNITIDFNGGHIHSIDLVGSKNDKTAPSTILSINATELKNNGIVIEYF